MGGAFALTFIMVFFWMPESAYMREALNIDTGDTNVTTPFLWRLHSSMLTSFRSWWKKEIWNKSNTPPALESRHPNLESRIPRNCFHTVAMSTMSRSGIPSFGHSTWSRHRPSYGRSSSSRHASPGLWVFLSLYPRFSRHRHTASRSWVLAQQISRLSSRRSLALSQPVL